MFDPSRCNCENVKILAYLKQECNNKTIMQKGFWIASQYTGIGAAAAGVVAFIIPRGKRG